MTTSLELIEDLRAAKRLQVDKPQHVDGISSGRILRAQADVADVKVRVVAKDIDRLGAAVDEITVYADPNDMPSLEERVTDTAHRFEYVSGGFKLIEKEPTYQYAVMRTTPSSDNGDSNYYEMTLAEDGATLNHYVVDASRRRRRAAANMTVDSLERIVDDMADLVQRDRD